MGSNDIIGLVPSIVSAGIVGGVAKMTLKPKRRKKRRCK